VHDPLGMMAVKLEVRVHMVTSASSATQNLVTAVNRAGVHVDDTVFEPLACADSVLRSDERELGICLADIGAGSTELAVFHQGAVAFTGVIPIGGDHFTSDLSVGLCTPVNEAEKLKKLYGNAIVTLIPEGNEVEVPSVGDRPSCSAAVVRVCPDCWTSPSRYSESQSACRGRSLSRRCRPNLPSQNSQPHWEWFTTATAHA